MPITQLRLARFRNHFESIFEVGNADTIFLNGPNGAGKTSVLEALHLCATGIGMRSRRDKELMMFDKEGYRIDFSFDDGRNFSLKYLQKDGRTAFHDDVEFSKWLELIGILRMTCLKPDDIELIEGAPAVRRRFLDILLSQMDKKYFSALCRYRRALKQAYRAERSNHLKLAGSFSQLMIEDMPYIFLKRDWVVKKLSEIISLIALKKFSDMTIELEYKPAIPSLQVPVDWNKISETCLKENIEFENAGVFHRYGPLRDEVILKFNGIKFRQFGSQGQKRIGAILLKIAESSILSEGYGHVILVDDVFGELDSVTRDFLLELLKNSKGQVWIAGTETEIFENRWQNWRKFELKSGRIEKITNSGIIS